MKKCSFAFQNNLVLFFCCYFSKIRFFSFLFKGCIFEILVKMLESSVKILRYNLNSKKYLLSYTEREIVVAHVPSNVFNAKLKSTSGSVLTLRLFNRYIYIYDIVRALTTRSISVKTVSNSS